MAPDTSQIKAIVKEYILLNCLQNKQISNITDSTPLISGRLLDSISTIQLVGFLEEKFNVEFEAHEVDKDNFETIEIISQFVKKKL